MMQSGTDYQQFAPSDYGGETSKTENWYAQNFDDQEQLQDSTGRVPEPSLPDMMFEESNGDEGFQAKHTVSIYSQSYSPSVNMHENDNEAFMHREDQQQ